ncbi:hypothetical protein [Butyrivibrio fibrisolvens]|uniref:hypothetical protein n=1 Tax=Butyrivibrio fibrisolvens TaxID=831 RepID=UPI0020BE5613|nr:hypothetical protein [Butyrivibrio fibrisolvens]
MTGMKIILSGTDSLGLLLSTDDELYDRSYTIHIMLIPFRDNETVRRYIDTAITRNIQHRLACYRSDKHFRHLIDLYENGELTGAINRIIEQEM